MQNLGVDLITFVKEWAERGSDINDGADDATRHDMMGEEGMMGMDWPSIVD